MVDELVRKAHVEPINRDLGLPGLKDFSVVYQAGSVVDLSPARRERIIAVYTRDLVARRLGLLGGGLGLALIGLTGLAGYIRADEATKGYYTNRLRLPGRRGRRRRERGDVPLLPVIRADRSSRVEEAGR